MGYVTWGNNVIHVMHELYTSIYDTHANNYKHSIKKTILNNHIIWLFSKTTNEN